MAVHADSLGFQFGQELSLGIHEDSANVAPISGGTINVLLAAALQAHWTQHQK